MQEGSRLLNLPATDMLMLRAVVDKSAIKIAARHTAFGTSDHAGQ